MNFFVALTAFAVIFPAELPDKSMIAAVVLSTRFRPLPVWIGLAAAFVFHVVIAVAAGSVIDLLPKQVVNGLVAAFFLIGAGVLIFGSEDEEKEEGEKEALGHGNPTSNLKIMAMAFGIIFVSEWGDLTQIATVNLTARYHDPLSVGVGALLALWLITGLGVLLGNRLVRVVPLALVRRVAGAILLGLAAWAGYDLVNSFS